MNGELKMEKKTFLGHKKPLLVCMIQAATPEDAVAMIRTGETDGADAYGFQMESLKNEYQNEETIRAIFAEMNGKPIYVTNYASGTNKGKSYEELIEGLKMLVRCGATLVDIMGDYFAPDPIQLTGNGNAIRKQIALIDEFHAMGAEVLMSSHVLKFTSAEEVLRIAKAQRNRGADIAKIVVSANSASEEMENLRIVSLLKEELGIPFLFLCNGTHHKYLRQFGPMLGCCVSLVVPYYHERCTRTQPELKKMRVMVDNFVFPEV